MKYKSIRDTVEDFEKEVKKADNMSNQRDEFVNNQSPEKPGHSISKIDIKFAEIIEVALG